MDVKPISKLFQLLKYPGPSGWTAIFTGVLVVFTCLEWGVSRDTSEIQRSSERAYLTFAGPQLGARMMGGNNLGSPDAPWLSQEIGLIWLNNGETPAGDVVVKTGGNAFSPDIPDKFDFPLDNSKIPMVVGPKSNYGTNISIARDVLVDNLHAKKRIFIWGTAVYRDVFHHSPERLTEFCVEMTHLTVGMLTPPSPASVPAGTKPTQDGQVGTPTPPAEPIAVDVDSNRVVLQGFQWQQCHAHNCYDEQCEDYKDRVADMRK